MPKRTTPPPTPPATESPAPPSTSSRFWYDGSTDGPMYFRKVPKLKPKVTTKPKG